MPIDPADQVIQITIIAELDSQDIYNCYHYVKLGGGMPLTLQFSQGLATDYYDNYVNIAAYKLMFNPLYEIKRVHGQIIYPVRNALGSKVPVGGIAGTRAGTPLPTSTQWSVTTLTDMPGPGGRGGNRYCGFNADDVEDSEITAAFGIDGNDGVLALYSPILIAGNPMDPLVYKRNDPLGSNRIVQYILEDEVRTMRRRVVGRGI